MDSLRYQNDYLLICNNALSMSCCDFTPTGYYWDAVPCDADIDPEKYCFEPIQSPLSYRKYINIDTKCLSNTYDICESKRLRIDRAESLVTGVIFNQFSATFSPSSAGSDGSIDYGFDSVTFNGSATGFVVNITGMTLSDLTTTVNGMGGEWFLSISNLNGLSSASIIAPTSIVFNNNYPSNTQHNFNTVRSSIILEYGRGGPTGTAYWDENVGSFATGVLNALNEITRIRNWTRVLPNLNYNRSPYSSGAFEIVFDSTGIINGETACGYAKENIYIKRNHLAYTDPSYVQINDVQNADYRTGWFSQDQYDDYLRLGSGIYDGTDGTVGNLCPLESRRLEVGNIDGGPYPIDSHSGQCVPQRGGKIGSRQPISALSDGTDGYSWNSSSEFDNLENTVVVDGTCYRVPPFFFLYGKNGRFNYEPPSTRSIYVPPNCNISTTGSTGCGTGLVPTNCVLDLFISKFSIECPWGPFGKYFDGILNSQHPTQNINPAAGRTGKDYRPSGWVKTRGEWTSTKEIDVGFVVHQLVPFYLGTSSIDDRIFSKVDTTTASGFTISSSGNTGCSPTILTFYTNGRTIGDFVNAVNGLRIEHSPGTQFGTPIFDFELSHSGVATLPADRIINVSSELFDLAYQFEDYDNSRGTANPMLDLDPDGDNQGPFSGSDIFAPIPYSDMWPKLDHLSTNTTQRVNIYNGLSTGRSAKLPPHGRHRTRGLPKQAQNDVSLFRQKTSKKKQEGLSSPWWQAMAGGVETVIILTPPNEIPSGINKIEVECVNRKINVYGMHDSVIISSGSVDTKKNFEYTVASGIFDINNLSMTVGSTTFNPLVANSGSLPYKIWLDDYTYWSSTGIMIPLNSGDVSAEKTPYNFSYREPLLEASRTDIISRGQLNLKSWVRQRTTYTDNLDSTDYKDVNLLPCTPYDSSLRINDDQIDCSSDNVYLDNYVLSYGCTSNICKTEWFIKASRCACDKVYRCESSVPHPFNQEGDSVANEGVDYGNIQYDNYSVTQPTIYICKENIHVDCDIPFLVKVPYQAVSSTTGYMSNLIAQVGTPRFVTCSSGTTDVYYADGQDALNERILFGGYTCGYNHTPNIYKNEGDFLNFCTDCVGWCQYIDPSNPILVAKEDIPMQWPPKAYVVSRGYPVFCSINPYKDDISNVCDPFGIPSECSWDKIVGLHPNVPPQYLNSDGSLCANTYIGDRLQALTRPMINNFTTDDLCNDGGKTRIDITCGTKCCECDFRCNTTDGAINDGPKAAPCTRDYHLSRDLVRLDVIYCNDNQYNNGVVPNSCNYSVCVSPIQVGSPDARPLVIHGLVQTTTSIDGFYRETVWPDCGCVPSRINGTITAEETLISLFDCTSVKYAFDPITQYADPTTATTCNDAWTPNNLTYNLSCVQDDIDLMTANYSHVSYSTSGAVRGPNCGPGETNRNLTSNYDQYFVSNATNTTENCGAVTNTWDITTTQVYNGSSPFDSESLGIFFFNLDSAAEIHPTWEETDSGTYTVDNESCAACTAPSDGTSYSSVTGWLQYNYFNSVDWYRSPNIYGVTNPTVTGLYVYPTRSC